MALALATGSKNSAVGSTTVTSTAIASNASGSGFVVVITFDRAATLTNLTSNKETLTLSSWTLVDAVQDNSGGGFKTAMYLLPKGVGGSGHTFTATISASNTLTILVGQVTTTNGNGFLYDVGDSEIDGTSPFTNGPLSNTKIPGLMLTCMGGASGSNPATHAESTGYTILTGADETNGASFWTSALASKAVAATGSQVASWTETGGTTAVVDTASIYEAPSAVTNWNRLGAQAPGRHAGPRRFKAVARGYPLASGSPDVTVALTGSAIGFAAGTLVPSASVAITGSAYTWSSGALSPNNLVALSGSAVAFATGTLTPSTTVALSGSALSFATGALIPSTTVALTGATYSWSTGTMTGSTGGNVTVALSGATIGFATGTLAVSGTVALTGTAVAIATGTLAVNHAQALTGVAEAYSTGTLAPSTTVSLAGQLVSFSTGTMTAIAGGNVTVALTGAAIGFSTGQMTASGGDVAPPDTQQTPAGRSRRRRYLVEIDGRDFEVDSVAAAWSLLEQARALARRNAAVVAERIAQKRVQANKPVHTPSPIIKTDAEELRAVVAQTRAEITDLYRQAAIDAEIRLRLQQKLKDDDEDDDDVLLLL